MATVAHASHRLLSLPRVTLLPLTLLAVVVGVGLGVVGYRGLDALGAFDVQRVAVSGSARVTPEVRKAALAAIDGRSLLRADPDAIAARIAALPTVRSATVDRAFPHTLRIRVTPERAVAVAPSAQGTVVLSSTGRVMGMARRSGLPVVSAAPADVPGVGGLVSAPRLLEQVALAAAPRRDMRLAAIGYGDDGLLARTAGGIDLRLGDGRDLAVKLKVARAVLRRAAAAPRYVDVTVPTAPVLRAAQPDPLTVNAPVSAATALPPVGDLGDWVAGAAPAESIRTLFG